MEVKPTLERIISCHSRPLIISSAYGRECERLSIVADACCEHYGIPINDVLSKCRRLRITMCRQMICYLARIYITNMSDTEIGQHLNLHRTCIGKFFKQVREQKKLYGDVRDDIEKLKSIITEKLNTL